MLDLIHSDNPFQNNYVFNELATFKFQSIKTGTCFYQTKAILTTSF